MSKRSDLLKSIIKNINEDAVLNTFLKSRGINPEHVTKNQKVAHSKMGEFLKWKRDHMYEETDKKDMVCFDIPLLIRVLEFTREDVSSDIELHNMVERLINMRHDVPMDMSHYDEITQKLVKENHIAIAMGKMLDDEGSMVLNQIEELERGCAMIRDYIGKDYEKQLPAWVQSKVTLATDYMSTVGNYLSSKSEKVKEEVESIDEISKELTHSYLKKRYAQTGATRQDKPKGMPRATHDKQLMGLNRATKRLTTTLELPKGTDPSQGGKYTADSVEIDGTPIQEGSAALRLAQALRKEREARELKDKSREAAERNEKKPAKLDNVFGITGQTLKKENTMDSLAATGAPNDGANSPDDVAPKDKNKKLIQMSKSARIIKNLYKQKGMKEETFDTEKEDKSVATYGKKPKLTDNEKKIDAVGSKSSAAAIMTGGTTLTGTPRDTIEIDPMMQLKPGLMGQSGQAIKPKNNNR